MTTALTDLATTLETKLKKLATDGLDHKTLFGYQMGYRTAMADAGALGEMEDDALARHFETWFATEPGIPKP